MNKALFNGSRPNVYFLVYDAQTQITTLFLGNSPIPQQSTNVVGVYTLKTFKELNYYYNALSDNIGKENVGITWKQDADNHLRYLYIGQGLNGSVVGSDGGINPTPSNPDSLIFFSLNSDYNYIVFPSNSNPYKGYAVGSENVQVPKDTDFDIAGTLGQDLNAITAIQYDINGNVLKEDYCFRSWDAITIEADTVKVGLVNEVFTVKNQSTQNLFVTTDPVRYYDYSPIGSVSQSVTKFNQNFGVKASTAAAANIDITVYVKGVQVSQTLNYNPNIGGAIGINRSADVVIITDNTAPPAPPTPPSQINWFYQRSTSEGAGTILVNNVTQAESIPGALNQAGLISFAGGDTIKILGSASNANSSPASVRILVYNATDAVTVSDTTAPNANSYIFNAVADKVYQITISTVNS